MSGDQERALFELYSRGEISRGDLERRLGDDVPFGDALLKLYEYNLPLPRPKPDLHSPGAQLMRSLLRRAPHG